MVEVDVEPISLKSSRTIIAEAVSAIVILIPLINMAFGTHYLIPSEPQQAAMVTLIGLLFLLATSLYVMYRRAYVTRSPTVKNKKFNALLAAQPKNDS